MLNFAALTFCAALPGEVSFESTNWMSAPEPAARADRLSELLPADSFLVVRVESIQAVLDDANQLMGKSATDAERLSAEKLLGELDGDLAQFAARIALDRPAGWALRFGEGSVPLVWMALPATDCEALALELAQHSESITAIAAQDYLVVATETSIQAPPGGCTAIAELEHTDVAFHLDIAAVMAKFRPLVDMGLEQAEMALAEAPDEQQAAAEEYFDLTRDVLDSARTLRVSLDSHLGRLRVEGELTVAEGSKLAGFVGGTRRNLASAAGLLDPEAALACLSMSDPHKVGRRQLDWTESIAESAPEKLSELLRLELDAWERLLPATTGLSAFNLDFALDGLRCSSYVEAKEPAVVAEEIQRVLRAAELAEMGLGFEGPVAAEIAGVTWSEYHLRMDLDTLSRFFDESASIDPDDRAEAERAIEIFLGQGGLRVAVAPLERFVVVRVGGDEAFARSTVARLHAKPTGLQTGVLDALARTRHVQAAWLMHVDLGRLLNQFADLAASLGQEIDLPVALLGDEFPITVHAAIDGSRWRAGLDLDAADIAQFVRALENDK